MKTHITMLYASLVASDCNVCVLVDDSVGHDLGKQLLKFVAWQSDAAENPTICKVPLIVTPDPSARIHNGFTIPSEFVLSIFEMDQIPIRSRQLQLIYCQYDANSTSTYLAFSASLLRSMCVGAFRRYLFLDDENHGQGEMDFSELSQMKDLFQMKGWKRVDGTPWPDAVLEKIGNMDDDEPAGKAYKILFKDELEKQIIPTMVTIRKAAKQRSPRRNTATLSHE
ncbi:MAG: hypothetical protein WCK77_07525 [Verrucomicrobiota bacterium]